MEHVRLGNSGLQISAVILGCMTYGDPTRGSHEWTIGLDESRPFIRQAIELGITTFDTANVYSDGSGEEILGALLREHAPREQVVIATKVFGTMRPGPHGGGLSRVSIMEQIDASLTRLGTDYVDLYQIHRFDPNVPIEETMEALHDVVRAGKARYIGASSMFARQFIRMQHAADLHGWTRFVSMQDQYNLLYREEEREMHPYCVDEGIGVIPWSPLARGRLAREWGATSARTESDEFAKSLYQQSEESDRRIVDAVGTIAAAREVTRAQVALAWVAAQNAVSAPIVGANRPHHLEDAAAAVALSLSDDERASLERHYLPHSPEGF